jgi:quinol monooxygenase YgiN
MALAAVCECAVFELRQYTLLPGRRDELVELFERHFRDGLEAAGMHVVGEFRDLDDPDRFVWIRGFRSMADRKRALTDFYLKSRVWRDHREQANATMIDSDDVLLLRPLDSPASRPVDFDAAFVVATIYSFDAPVTAEFVAFFRDRLAPIATETGASILGFLETEPAENTFPGLPVREGENVFVWFASFDGTEAFQEHLARLDQHEEWSAEILPGLTKRLTTGPQRLRLASVRDSRPF